MELNATESEVLAAIAGRHSTNMQAAIKAAYEAGILEGALRMTRMVANAAIAAPAPTVTVAQAGADAALSARDLVAIRAMGIDPAKKMRQRNSVFTIVGYQPSRWKFPITVATQNGTRYKMTVDQIKRLQGV